MNDYQNPVEFRLTDGTHAVLTDLAAFILEDDYGITKGRLKRAAGGHSYVAVTPTGPKWRGSKEIHLKDLLAVWVYNLPEVEEGQRYVLADGDARNLMPGNFAATALPEIAPEPEQPADTKHAVVLDTPAIRRQLDLLADAMRNDSHYIKNGEAKSAKSLLAIGKKKLHNPALAEEVLGQAVLEIATQIRAGKFRGTTDGEFYAWIRAIARAKFGRVFQAVIANCVGDIEHDEAEIELIKHLRASGTESTMLERTEFSQSEGSAGYY